MIALHSPIHDCNTHPWSHYIILIMLALDNRDHTKYSWLCLFQEELIATEDLFRDYFNAYLSLPVSIL